MAHLTKKIYFLLTVLVIVVCLSVLHFEDRIFSIKSFRGYRPVLFYTRNSSEKKQISVLPMSSLLSVARSSFTSPVPSLSTTWLKNGSVLSACKPPGKILIYLHSLSLSLSLSVSLCLSLSLTDRQRGRERQKKRH